MDSLAALVAEAQALTLTMAAAAEDADLNCPDCCGDGHYLADPDAESSAVVICACTNGALWRRLLAALRPYLAPVGLEAFEGLRREHWHSDDPYEACAASEIARKYGLGGPCDCGADAHNALLAQCTAAHAAALAEVAALRDKLTVRGVHCMWCRAVVGEVHHDGSPDAQKEALDVAQQLAEEHDPTCPKNPYTAEVAELRRELAAANEHSERLADVLGRFDAACGMDCNPDNCDRHAALSAHRARVGGGQ